MSECVEKGKKLIEEYLDTGKCLKAEFVGSVRRKETPKKDVDIVCADNTIPHNTESIDRFLKNSCSIDLYRAHPDHFGSMVLAYTGPKGSTLGMRRIAGQKGMLLNQYGLFDRGTGELIASTEEEICQKVLNRPCKPPELRGR